MYKKHNTDTHTRNIITKISKQKQSYVTDNSNQTHEAKINHIKTKKQRHLCRKNLQHSERRTRYFEHCHACEHQKRNNNLVPQFCSNISATIVFAYSDCKCTVGFISVSKAHAFTMADS